jgi:hypothetical protein
MIHLVLGRQGSGKTLYLVKKAYEYYKAGLTIYSNVHLNFPYKKLNYKDIIDCKLENGLVIIDEIHLLLPARNSMRKINREICDSFLSMVRKKGLIIYGSTQIDRKVDVRFREEKDFLHICKKFAFYNEIWSEVMHNQNLNKDVPIMIDIESIETFSGNSIKFNFIANPFFKLYDTKQIIKIKGI